jgi:hypothetical protein
MVLQETDEKIDLDQDADRCAVVKAVMNIRVP